MKDDKIFTLSEYKAHLINMVGHEHDEGVTNRLVSLKLKTNILGILCKDDCKPASKKKMIVKDIMSHLERCLELL